MSDFNSHWGLSDDSATEGSYPTLKQRPEPLRAEVVLTEAGEVLIHKERSQSHCVMAIVISKNASALSRPQVERMPRAWDIALAVANGQSEAVHLQPMPHHWRFSRVDYMTWDEWLKTKAPGGHTGRAADDAPLRPHG